MVEIYNENKEGLNTEGLLLDIHEDDGYERYDLIVTVLEYLVDDVRNYMFSGSAKLENGESDGRDKDMLYALVGLLSEVDKEVLLQYLPKDNSIYMPELCGALRLESWTSQNRMVSRDNICPGESE